MIPISLSTALIVYSSLIGFFMIGIWLYTELSARRSYQFLERQFLWRCVFCGYTYLDEEAETISRCPRCESFNSVEDKHARFIKVRDFHTADTAPDEPQRNTSHRKRPHQRRRGPRRRA